MSRHRAILVALATLFTAGTTSAALACCEWGNPAPLAYQWSGCGGCGPAVAPVTYAEPVFAGGCGGCGAPLATYAQPAVGWGGGCGCNGCGGCGGGYATPAIEPTPIAPSPIYVVNQGPDYTGPGIMVPYRVYGPGAGYAPPPAYSYVTGEPYPAGYGMNPYYAGAGPVVPYRERAYYHHRYPRYAGPVGPYRPYPRYPHRPLGVRY
jgi:hypothetical protein